MTKKKSGAKPAPKPKTAKAKSATLPPPNATRAAELAQAKAERAKAKAAKANGAQSAVAKTLGKRAQIEADAKAGKLPPVPDFSAETHKRFRPRLDELVGLVKAKDVKGLKAVQINPVSTSPKAMARYRDLAVTALEAQGA